ncbi:hypothetical protein OZX56_06735 [Lactobacillus sp. ESL0684]|uniref:hypothetical protein n=1 Tax=Lactobacillus sp. ESL0684 TaxID=2983213 RepID=UPI0023F6670C|nr:hypothetical protein [Lactobacillus sp. ESL0684]WEV43228.1 hypothetical protein OZX56_06735 [Lactobacillus sp. ESL0684]
MEKNKVLSMYSNMSDKELTNFVGGKKKKSGWDKFWGSVGTNLTNFGHATADAINSFGDGLFGN